MTDAIAIRQAHPSAWRAFAKHHYLSGRLAPIDRAFVAEHRGHPVAIVIYAHAGIGSRSRREVLPKSLALGPLGPRLTAMRDGLRILHRLVVLPSMRGRGIAQRLIAQTVGTLGVPYVECVARDTSPMLAAGFVDIGQVARPRCFERLREALARVGVDLDDLVGHQHYDNDVTIGPHPPSPLHITHTIHRATQVTPSATRDFLACLRHWAETHRPSLRGRITANTLCPEAIIAIPDALKAMATPTRYCLYTHPAAYPLASEAV